MSLIRLLVVLALVGAGCRAPDDEPPALHVYAASSLTEVFADLALAFEAAHPEVDVRLSFAGSQALRLQIEHGARADVFASANPEHLAALVATGRARPPEVFAHNALVVIVPARGSAVTRFAELPRAERLVLGAQTVPVGRYAREALARAAGSLGADFPDRVLARVVSHENNTRLVRAKVALGEADAALVYRTDAAASPRVKALPLPPFAAVRAEYSMSTIADSGRRAEAKAWIAFVRSAAGRAILARRGFALP